MPRPVGMAGHIPTTWRDSPTVLGDIHPRRSRGGGIVEIGSIDFQCLWEGWKNSFIVFPRLSIDRHFHRLARLPPLWLPHNTLQCRNPLLRRLLR